MSWIRPLAPEVEDGAEALGGKAHGLIVLRRLGLPVPPGFVIGTGACRAFLRTGRLPDGLAAELSTAVADLEAATGRAFGGPGRPLTVSVRSGAGTSMPGMMSTVLNLGLTAGATAALAEETGDPRFAREARLRFLLGYAAEVAGVPPQALTGARATADRDADEDRLGGAVEDVERLVHERSGSPVPKDPVRQLLLAVAAVFASWHTPRARTYRELHGIADDLGTAVTVQAMVYGNRDRRSGSGVAFSRDPTTGAPGPFGEVLFGSQGDEVVSGRSRTADLSALAEREPAVWTPLREALHRLETHHRDACHVEFTFETGRLWLLQARPGGFVGRAAVRVAVDLAEAGLIGRDEAVLRVSPHHLRQARTPRLAAPGGPDLLTRGLGASPGVAVGRVATTADAAVRLAAMGPVVLVRPETSPLDLHGLAAATGVVTARGGPTSHAAVVARSLGRPAVVGAADLTVDAAGARIGSREVPEGTLVTIDGTGGEVVSGRARLAPTAPDPRTVRLLDWADALTGDPAPGREDAERLAAARAVLLGRRPRT
ncbi:pyruvate, phosphate dikinase [Streptomyces sp. NPDC002490]|uniref:pyruvate, phosphate dikinase n=1 Tax=Streptomyces sp. NPDC002490 TaxID=3154416 RepID=UPI0033347033